MARIADKQEKQERMIQELAILNAELSNASAALKEGEEALQPLKDIKEIAAKKVVEKKSEIRSYAAELDKADLHPAVSQYMSKTWVYDEGEIKRWLIDNMPVLLKVDKEALKQMLNAAADSTKLTGIMIGPEAEVPAPVEFSKVLSVKIKDDLTAYLPVAEETEEQPEEPAPVEDGVEKLPEPLPADFHENSQLPSQVSADTF